MTRRDRTTGLPRRREREAAAPESRFRISERMARIGIIGGVVVLLLAVLGLIGAQVYDENIGKPNKTILRVEDEEFKLRYFADRLPNFAQENPSLVQGIREPQLLTKLEEEALTVKMAEERGIDLSDEAVTSYIATDLGTAAGGTGSAFDTLYRQRLRETGLSSDDYRKLSRAALAEQQIIEQLEADIPETGTHVQLRMLIVGSEAEANDVVERIQGGEDMGEIAREESLDSSTREEQGIVPLTPPELFPEEIRTLIEGQPDGTLVEPVLLSGNWWVMRIEDTDDDATYSAQNRTALAEQELTKLLDEAREAALQAGDIQRSLNDDDISWAYNNLP